MLYKVLLSPFLALLGMLRLLKIVMLNDLFPKIKKTENGIRNDRVRQIHQSKRKESIASLSTLQNPIEIDNGH